MTHAESLAEWSRLQSRKWHLHNRDFIAAHIRDIADILCFYGSGTVGAVFVGRLWLDEQSEEDKSYIEDYCKWLIAEVN